MSNPTLIERIGILESYTPVGKWVELVISGEESSMKYGELMNLYYYLVEETWGSKYRQETDAILKINPNWPIGAKVKHLEGRIVAIWIPTKDVWVRIKR